MIILIEDSPLKNKRFRVYLSDDRHFDFGQKGGETYIDHSDKVKRENYKKRHLANIREKYNIDNFIPSPSLFSYYLLWGDSNKLSENIKKLNLKI